MFIIPATETLLFPDGVDPALMFITPAAETLLFPVACKAAPYWATGVDKTEDCPIIAAAPGLVTPATAATDEFPDKEDSPLMFIIPVTETLLSPDGADPALMFTIPAAETLLFPTVCKAAAYWVTGVDKMEDCPIIVAAPGLVIPAIAATDEFPDREDSPLIFIIPEAERLLSTEAIVAPTPIVTGVALIAEVADIEVFAPISTMLVGDVADEPFRAETATTLRNASD